MLAVQNLRTTAQVLTIILNVHPAVVFAFCILFIVPTRYLRILTRTLRHILLLHVSRSFKNCLFPKHVTVANSVCGSSDVFTRQITLRHIWYCFRFDTIRRSDELNALLIVMFVFTSYVSFLALCYFRLCVVIFLLWFFWIFLACSLQLIQRELYQLKFLKDLETSK